MARKVKGFRYKQQGLQIKRTLLDQHGTEPTVDIDGDNSGTGMRESAEDGFEDIPLSTVQSSESGLDKLVSWLAKHWIIVTVVVSIFGAGAYMSSFQYTLNSLEKKSNLNEEKFTNVSQALSEVETAQEVTARDIEYLSKNIDKNSDYIAKNRDSINSIRVDQARK